MLICMLFFVLCFLSRPIRHRARKGSLRRAVDKRTAGRRARGDGGGSGQVDGGGKLTSGGFRSRTEVTDKQPGNQPSRVAVRDTNYSV